MKRIFTLLLTLMIAAGCGTVTEEPDDDLVNLTGIIQVLLAGTRSETVILEVQETGEVFALVGDTAYELVPIYGTEIVVTGRLTDEGWSVRPELQKVHVLEYAVLDEQESPD